MMSYHCPRPPKQRAFDTSLLMWRRRMLGGGAIPANAYAVGGNEPEFVADFAGVLNSGTEYYRSGGSDTTFSSVFTHSGLVLPATMTDSDGSLKWAPHNLYSYHDNFEIPLPTALNVARTDDQPGDPKGGSRATRIVGTSGNWYIQRNITGRVIGASYVWGVWVKSNTGSNQTFRLYRENSFLSSNLTATTEWQLFTLPYTATSSATQGDGITRDSSGNDADLLVWGMHLYRNDLGGMANNPDQPAGFETLVPTAATQVFLPRRNHHVWNGTSWEKAGILIEPAAATNLLLNSGTLSTQSVTVTAVAHTLHFTGTGTITLSGASTAGPLVGTGTGENNRVSLTFTPSAGSLTCTVSGTVTNAQLEVGSVPTSYIPTAGGTVTRAAETLTVAGANLPANTTGVSVQMQGRMTYADLGTEAQRTFWRWYNGASDFLLCDLDTDGADTGEVNANQSDTTGGAGTVAIDAYSPGINVAYNIASRHSNTDINLAVDGTAGTADATPTALHDASSDTFQVAHNLQGTVGMLRVWGVGLSDTNLESAT